MLELAGRSIIHRQIEAFRAAGVKTFVVVVGFEADRLRAHLADQAGTFRFIQNDRFAETNTLYSLYLAREHLVDGFVYANADVIFDHRLPRRLADADAALAVRMTPHMEEEEVKVELEGARIRRIGKGLDPLGAAGEFMGVARFDRPVAAILSHTVCELIERGDAADAFLERALDCLADTCPLTAVDVTDLPCCEIDFPQDLDDARREIAPRLAP